MNLINKCKQLVKLLFQKRIVIPLSISYVNPSQRFVGHNVLVTGGSSGIGLAIAKAFLAEGAEVIICARKIESLQKVYGEYNNGHLHILEFDISDISKIESKLHDADIILNNSIDIFINAAGVSAYEGDIMNEEMYDYICDINQKGLFYMNKIEGDYLINNQIHGKIINITSKAGERIGFDPYTLSKWGATSITYGNARRLASYHINVNGIAPGRVPTNITKELQSYKGCDNAFTPNHSTKRFTQPEEVAAVALFLASGSANNIVGQIIVIDGGSYN